ncbi:MAG: ATP-binding protein [Saprospiraceae bacterium]|nr:ATP-binding protein [Saprospiraceae bacterium]
MNIFGALTLFFVGFLAAVEHEIYLAISLDSVFYLDKIHTCIAIGLVMLSNVMGNLFLREKQFWVIHLERILLFTLVGSGVILLLAILLTKQQVVYNLKQIDGLWTYNVRQSGWLAEFYKLWFIFAVLHLSLTFLRSYWTANTLSRKRIRFFIFLAFSIVPLFLIYQFVISPDEETKGSYFVSPLLICGILGLNWVFTDFELFKINPANAVNNLLDSLSGYVLILNPALRIKFFNESFKKVVGNDSIEELDNIHLRDLLVWVNANLDELELDQLKHLKKGDQISTTLTISNSGEDIRFFTAKTSPVFNSLGFKTGYIIISNEVTESKRQEEALKKYTQELEISNQELERFAHIASHDLKSPLRNINSFVNLIERRLDLKKDPKLLKYLKFVTNSVSYMYSLIQDILEYSTLNHEKKIREQEVNLNSTIERIKETLAAQIEEGAHIKADPLPTLFANSSLLFQLFFNLIENGLKYNQHPTPEVKIRVYKEADFYQFSISDNGIGIDPKFNEQIFEMFSRLHVQTTYEGTGIGLAICKKIVHLYDGKIWMESELGKGTSFFFTIKQH